MDNTDTLTISEITKYLINVPLSSTNNYLTIYTSWLSDLIEIKILSDTHNYQSIGIILIDDIKSSAKDLEISFEHFYNECQDALSTVGGLKNFIYSMHDNKFIIQKNDSFKITYLEVDIHHTTENLKDFFITESIEIINSMRSNFSKLKRKCIQDNCDYGELEKSYKKFIEEKDCLEQNLLSKFIVILNSKKDKITELQGLIDQNQIVEKKLNDDNEKYDIDENDDIFSVKTQEITIDSYPNQLPQTQKKFINLPKRKNISDNPSNSKATPPRHEIPSCSKNTRNNTTDLNENSEDFEMFKDM